MRPLEAVVERIPKVHLSGVMHRTGCDRAAAEDICFSAALDLLLYWRREGGLDKQRTDKAFNVILDRRICDYFEKRKREVRHLPLDGADHIPTCFDGPPLTERLPDPAAERAHDEVLEALVQPKVITDLLCGISQPQREALGLIYGAGLDQATAATRLCITKRGLQERLRKARAMLMVNFHRHRAKAREEDNR